MTPVENVAVLATSAAPTREGSTIGNSYLFKDLIGSFGAQRDDEAVQRRDRSTSHRRAGHLAVAASLWEHQLVSPTFSKKENMSLKRMSGMLILKSARRKNTHWWTKVMLTMAKTMNGMVTFTR